MGHVRLSIRDLSSAGTQPFCDEQNGVYVVVNGEFYGLKDLVKELAEDYDFSSRSDSEIVIPLYLKYGNLFLTKLRGEFSIVLYDARSHTLLAARDRYGVKPLFWTVVEGRLLIASEAKAFLPLGLQPEWDIPSILEDAWLHDERTLFRGVRKFRPGYYMTCSSFEYIQHRQYWDMDFADKRIVDERTEEEMTAALRQQLLDAVRLRLESDVPVGIYLSGGIDSSVLAGMTAELHQELNRGLANGKRRQRPVCFSIGFEGRDFDESEVAKRTADFLDLELQVQRIDEEALADNFVEATWHSEHHNPDLNYIGKYLVSALSRDHGFNVVLNGNGADEHFGGYEHYRPDFLREPDLTRPQSSRLTEYERATLVQKEEESCNPGYVGTDRSFAENNPSRPRTMLNDTSIISMFWPVTIADLAPWTRCYGDLSRPQARANGPNVRVLNLMKERWHPIHTAQCLEIKSLFPNLDLTCMGDRMEMAHSVEGRTPYLDHKLTAFANHLPPSVKMKEQADGSLTAKWILREAGKPYVTDEVYNRKKHVFSAPVRYRRDGPVHRMFKNLLEKRKIDELGFLESEKAEHYLEKAFGDDFDANAMRYVINVGQWIVLSEKFGVKKAQEEC